jgi:hypothetical protein
LKSGVTVILTLAELSVFTIGLGLGEKIMFGPIGCSDGRREDIPHQTSEIIMTPTTLIPHFPNFSQLPLSNYSTQYPQLILNY